MSVLGIGVTTRNRLAILLTTIAELARRTTALYVLVIADDGEPAGTCWISSIIAQRNSRDPCSAARPG